MIIWHRDIIRNCVQDDVPTLDVYYPDGTQTQRIGIVPDIEIKPTIKGIKEGRDEVLERAIQYIRED